MSCEFSDIYCKKDGKKLTLRHFSGNLLQIRQFGEVRKILQFTLLVVGVVVAVGDDDVVHEADAHQLAGTMDAAGQLVVGVAGREVAGRVVVTDGEDGGVGENGLLHDDADVYDSLADAASGNPHFPDEAVVLIEQQHPELFDVEVLHLRVHLVVDLGGCLKFRTFFG